ncbi:MAG: succinate dehydrogenase cytochrome b subunit [Bacteroidota bacterium]
MSTLSSLIDRSVGRKLVMGITGLFLVSFLFVHMSGNLLLFKSDGGLAFNEYTKFMTTNPLIRVAEWILFAGFIAHIIYAAILTRKNNQARPTKYAYNKNAGKSSSWFSRNMGLTGTVVLTFLVIHLTMFWGQYKFGDGTDTITLEQAYQEAWKIKEDVTLSGVSLEKGSYIDQTMYLTLKDKGADMGTTVSAVSMTEVVKKSFSNEFIVIFYVIAMLLIAMHLVHGFQSSFRSLGLVHKKYTPAIEKAGIGIAVVVPLIFAIMPVYYYIAHA